MKWYQSWMVSEKQELNNNYTLRQLLKISQKINMLPRAADMYSMALVTKTKDKNILLDNIHQSHSQSRIILGRDSLSVDYANHPTRTTETYKQKLYFSFQ